MMRPRDGKQANVRTLPLTGRPLAEPLRAKLDAYLDLLAKWNRVHNLTAIRGRAEMEILHARDALAVLPWLPARLGLRILDVGSGGGIPGIPLALARPDAHVVLLDSNGKKTAFLTQAVIEVPVPNARVVTTRIEDYGVDVPFDVVVARAFSDLATFAQVAKPHLADGGAMIAMKGELPHAEIAALPSDIAVSATPALEVPGLAARRHLVIMQKRKVLS